MRPTGTLNTSLGEFTFTLYANHVVLRKDTAIVNNIDCSIYVRLHYDRGEWIVKNVVDDLRIDRKTLLNGSAFTTFKTVEKVQEIVQAAWKLYFLGDAAQLLKEAKLGELQDKVNHERQVIEAAGKQIREAQQRIAKIEAEIREFEQ